MPGFDGTGPEGRGPMTGGAGGWCSPLSAPAADGYSGYPQTNVSPAPAAAGTRRPFLGHGRPRWGLGRMFPGRGFRGGHRRGRSGR